MKTRNYAYKIKIYLLFSMIAIVKIPVNDISLLRCKFWGIVPPRFSIIFNYQCDGSSPAVCYVLKSHHLHSARDLIRREKMLDYLEKRLLSRQEEDKVVGAWEREEEEDRSS